MTTLLFMAVCGFLIYSAVVYKPRVALVGLVVLMLGLPIYWFSTRGRKPVEETSDLPEG